MTVHTNFKPRKPGLIDRQISAAKGYRMVQTYRARKDVKADMMGFFYGAGGAKTLEVAEFAAWERLENAVRKQGARLSYSDRGDFTAAHVGGLYCAR